MNHLNTRPNPLLEGLRLPKGVQHVGFQYRAWRCFFKVMVCSICQVRVLHRHYEPPTGGVVYISNHQSFLDPVLVGFALRRPVNYMARDSLFRIPVFGSAIRSVNAFPVRRGTADTTAMRETIRRIKNGGQVAIFPEGTRTRDGRIGKFLPGVGLPARRAADWTVPVLIDGAFEAWPRGQVLPTPADIIVQYAPPIPQSEARKLKPRDFVEHIRQTLIEMQTDLRTQTGRKPLTY